MGVIGPTSIGSLYPPLLADNLRRLQPGEIHPPQQLGIPAWPLCEESLHEGIVLSLVGGAHCVPRYQIQGI